MNTEFFGDDIPTVFHFSATTFEIEGKTSEDCSLSIIWKQVTADDLCCKEIKVVAKEAFADTFSDELLGMYERQLIHVNDHSLYYKSEAGEQGERSWIAHSDNDWINKYSLPGRDLGDPITVGDGDCYYIKSHKKYSVAPYPYKRINEKWTFPG